MVNGDFELTATTEGNDNDALACHKVAHLANMLKEQDTDDDISLGTGTLTTDDEDDKNLKDDLEIIKLQYGDDDNNNDYYALSSGRHGNPDKDDDHVGNDNNTASLDPIIDGYNSDEEFLEGYTRMNLTGESDSDKDLIIYSLNESLQIHKTIVEQIQAEKDDLETYYEQIKTESNLLIQKERQEFEQEQTNSINTLNRLEAMYQLLAKQIEAKKTEYRHMEDKFHSHLKQTRPGCGEESSTEDQIYAFLKYVQELCYHISTMATTTDASLFFDRWPKMMNTYFEREAMTFGAVTMLTQKMMTEILIDQVLQTAIHPGISLNSSFGQIHDWVEKRNKSWASRMKQQISAFVVKQSCEEEGHTIIEAAKNRVVQHLLQQLNVIYPSDELDIQVQLTQLVDETAKLNLVLKCQEIGIENIDIGSTFNNQTMNSVMECQPGQETNDKLIVACVLSPHFVASDHHIIVPAKVHCV